MAGQTFETKIAYRLDPRGLREARKELEKTFKPASTRELNSALKEMRGMLKALTSEQVRLTTAMLGVKKGTDEYKKLEETLEGVEDRMKGIGKAAAAAAQAVRDAGHGSFSQGFLQGLSPAMAGFLERGPGMRRQFLGQMAGGALRGGAARAVGATSAMMGGAGPFGTLLGNVPFIGGAAQLAEQSAGMAVDFQRARLAAMPFTGLTPGQIRPRGGRRESDEEMRARIGMTEQRAFAARTGPAGEAQRDFERQYDMAKAIARAAGFGEQGRQPGRVERFFGAEAEPSAADIAAGIVERREGEGLRKKFPEAVIPPETYERKRVPGYDPLGEYMRAGTRAVYSRQETMQAVGEFGQQVGRLPGAGEFQSALGLERLYGVDRGTSAQLLRQLRPGRGGATGLGEDMLASLVADALAEGLEGSEITEHLAHIAEMQEQAASRGMKIQSETLSAMAIGLGHALGLEGVRGGQVAGQLAGAAQSVVTQGARGPIDIQMLRAAGFRPELGQQSFFGARRKLANIEQGGFDADTMFDLLSNLTAGVGSEEEAGYTLERALGSAGVTVGPEEAIKMARGLAGGREAFAATLEHAKETGGIRTAEGVGKALDSADFKALTGTIRAQNAIQDKLLSAGSDMVGNVQKLQLQAASLADKMGDLAPHMGKVVDNIVTLSKGVEMLVDKINEWAANGTSPVPRQP